MQSARKEIGAWLRVAACGLAAPWFHHPPFFRYLFSRAEHVELQSATILISIPHPCPAIVWSFSHLPEQSQFLLRQWFPFYRTTEAATVIGDAVAVRHSSHSRGQPSTLLPSSPPETSAAIAFYPVCCLLRTPVPKIVGTKGYTSSQERDSPCLGHASSLSYGQQHHDSHHPVRRAIKADDLLHTRRPDPLRRQVGQRKPSHRQSVRIWRENFSKSSSHLRSHTLSVLWQALSEDSSEVLGKKKCTSKSPRPPHHSHLTLWHALPTGTPNRPVNRLS